MLRYIVALVAALLLNASANLLIKAAATKLSERGDLLANGLFAAVRSVSLSGLFIAGIVCFALNLLAYLYALQRLPISLGYPIMVTCGYAIIVVVAGLKMGEHLQPVQWAGVLLMLLGVWLVGGNVVAR